MRIRYALASLAAAAAVLAPAAPSHAAGVRPCDEPGHVGVIVFGGDGDIIGLCLRTGAVTDPVYAVADEARDYAAEVEAWVADARDTRCWSTPEYIVCEEVPPPPLPLR